MSKKEEILKKIKKFLKIFSENRNGYTPRKSTERTVANYYLTHTTYEGTQSQWNNINKVSGWNEKSPIATITCTDGVIQVN